ncbi:MAG: phasin family protein [Dokdonella sp.]
MKKQTTSKSKTAKKSTSKQAASRQSVSKQIASTTIAMRNDAESASRSMWLASLGAASLLRKNGEEMVGRLIREGQGMQKQADKTIASISQNVDGVVQSRVAAVKSRAAKLQKEFSKQVKVFETTLQNGAERVLARLGVPSKADIDSLIARIDTLSRQLRAAK